MTVAVLPKVTEAAPSAFTRGSFGIFLDHARGVTGANPIHLFAAWLAVLGAAIGPTRWGIWSGRVVPIFYSLLVGPTGDHKSSAMALALRYLPSGVSGVSGVTTDAGLFDHLQDADGQPVLLHFDEFGYLLEASQYRGSQLNAMLNDLFGAPPCLDRNLARRGKRKPAKRRVEKPFVGILAGTHPDTFWALLGNDSLAIASGFVNRFAPFVVDRGRSLPITQEPDEKTTQYLRDHLLRLTKLEPQVVGLSAPAYERWIEFSITQDEKLDGLPADLGAMTKRVRDHVARLALTFAVDEGENVIGLEQLEAVIEVGELLEQGYGKLLQGRQAENGPRRWAAIEDIALRVLRKKPGRWFTAREIIHSWPNTTDRPGSRELRMHLGEVDEIETETPKGRQTLSYRVRE